MNSRALLLAVVELSMVGWPALAGDVSLIGHWPLVNGAQDVSGNGHHGIAKDATPSDPGAVRPQGCFSFTGQNDTMVRVPGHPMFDAERMTVTAWVKGTGATRWARVVAKHDYAAKQGYALFFVEYNRAFAFSVFDADRKLWSVDTKSRPKADAWQFVAGTYDGKALRIYYDGVLEGVTQMSGKPLRYTPGDLSIGGSPLDDGYRWPMKGFVGDVRFYNRALSDSEIAVLHAGLDMSSGCSCPDSDGDGVPDAWDRCPGTPQGSAVTSNGCPVATAGVAAGLAEAEPNDTLATAQDLDRHFTNRAPSPVQHPAKTASGNLVWTSASYPWVRVQAKGEGTFDYFSFTVTAGSRAVFDIDDATSSTGARPDLKLVLWDAAGNPLAGSDNLKDFSWYFGTDPGSEADAKGQDPFFEWDFKQSGRYTLGVASSGAREQAGGWSPHSGRPEPGDAYSLILAVQNHPAALP